MSSFFPLSGQCLRFWGALWAFFLQGYLLQFPKNGGGFFYVTEVNFCIVFCYAEVVGVLKFAYILDCLSFCAREIVDTMQDVFISIFLVQVHALHLSWWDLLEGRCGKDSYIIVNIGGFFHIGFLSQDIFS